MTPRIRAHLTGVRDRLVQGDDRGQATGFVVCILAALWLFAGVVVDGGLALAGKSRALDVAQEAARSGAQQLDVGRLRDHHEVRLVRAEAARAARAYLVVAGEHGAAAVEGSAVTVRVTHHYRTQVLQLVGLRTLTVHAAATSHARRSTP
ncbi:pilus assembly protein TadG-related protein [Streptomyces sp. NPDC057555]|uniref:pilus assembly protein TadG-related protein n=1 Tax=Streptomyces sp. NPDC057555 TaxID=3346166 RepID=UPI00367CB7DE